MRPTLALLAACALHGAQAQWIDSYTMADGLPSNNVNDVASVPGGAVWCATQQGVAHFDGSSFTVHNTSTHPGLVNDDIQAIAVMANGDVWAGTDFGVSVFDGTAYTTYTTADGLGDDQVRNIKQAPNGDVWIATINGATRYRNGAFTAFGAPDIPFGGVMHIAFDTSNGDVWLSGGLGGVIIFDGTNFRYITEADGLISDRVRSTAFDDTGNKWIGTADGISVLDANDQLAGHHTRPFTVPPPDTLNPVTDVAIVDGMEVWAAVYVDYLVTVGGVCRRIGNNWTQYETTDGLAGPNAKRLAPFAGPFSSGVWVATSSGLTRFTTHIIGIPDRMTDAGFSLFPNPASSVLRMAFADDHRRRALEVYDAGMRLVRTEALSGPQAAIDVSDVDAGVYFARVDGVVRRFVVQR